MSKDLAFEQSAKRAQESQLWDTHEEPKPMGLVPLEFKEETSPELFGIEPVRANEMVKGLTVTIAERQILENAYIDVIELPVTTETLPTFKELRLKIQKNRTQGLTKWKEKEKSFYLAGGNFIQAIYNKEVAVNEQMESKLMDCEKFFERQEKEKAKKLNDLRIEKLKHYIEDCSNLDFSAMNDEDFDDYLLGKKTRFENEQKERKAEALRIENERIAEIERQKAIEVENAKLKAEAEAKEKALEKERAEAKAKQDAIELKAKKEREEAESQRKIEANRQASIQAEKDLQIRREKEAREKLEAEIKTKADAEEKAKLEAKKEAEKLAKAPIKEQLSVWVDSFEIPVVGFDNETAKEIIAKFESFKKWSLTQIEKI